MGAVVHDLGGASCVAARRKLSTSVLFFWCFSPLMSSSESLKMSLRFMLPFVLRLGVHRYRCYSLNNLDDECAGST